MMTVSDGIKCKILYLRNVGSPHHEVRVQTDGGNLPYINRDWQDFTIYPAGEERLTEAECWAKLREAVEEARHALPDARACVGVIPSREGSWEANDLNRTIDPHFMRARDPIAACNELAAHGRAQSVPAPDFDAMTEAELRAWLDKRGLLWDRAIDPHDGDGFHVSLTAYTRAGNRGGQIAYSTGCRTRKAAFLALCVTVHEQEASRA